MSTTGVVRVPQHVLLESKRMAALKGQQPGELLAAAWREYFESHRDEFAEDLEQAARLLRDGTLDDLAAFVSRNADDRAAIAAAAGRDQ